MREREEGEEGASSLKFWFCSFPIDNQKKLSLVINDLNGQLYLYDEKGSLIKQVLLGDSFLVNNNSSIRFDSFLTTTGIQIKSDPGIQTVYLSFLLLMVSIYVSFFTYSQIWLIQSADQISIGGNSNRAVLFFQQEFRKILKRVIKTTDL